jgi:hypothetical protein
MIGIIDRFEGDYVIVELESGEMINVLRTKIPDSAVEGDVLLIDGDKIIIDTELTRERKAIIDNMMKELFD